MKKPLKTDAELLCEALIENAELKAKNDSLKSENAWLKKQAFGRKSEKLHTVNSDQMVLSLFEEDVPIPGIKNSDDNTISTEPVAKTAASTRKGRKPIPDSLPAEEVCVEPKESELTCSCCGKNMVKIGQEESKSLEYVPAYFKVIKRIRPKYACRCGEGGFVIADTPSRPIEKSIAESSLLAYVTVGKYVDHLPLYRQSQIFGRYDVEISRSTMDGWLKKIHLLLDPVYDVMKKQTLSSEYLQMDETRIKVLKDSNTTKKKGAHLGWFWPFTDGKQVLFEYDPGRNKEVPSEILSEFTGTLQTDGFASYNKVVKDNNITRVGCWAHVRRKFFDALEHDKRAQVFLTEIGKLYAVEKRAHEACSDFEQRRGFRQKHSLPVLENIRQLLENYALSTLPKLPLGKAITYAKNQWDTLTTYCENGIVQIDNNRIENLIRPVALGRKNWLFAGSPDGARRAALFYSLLGSCKIKGINPFEYLTDVLDRINDTKLSELDQLTPMNWKPLSRV